MDFTSGYLRQLGQSGVNPGSISSILTPVAQGIARNSQMNRQQQQQDLILASAKLARAQTPEEAQGIIDMGVKVGAYDQEDRAELKGYGGNMNAINNFGADVLRAFGKDNMLPDSLRGSSSSELPSSVQETVWYQQQTPEVQKAHMSLKRRAEQSPEAKLAFNEQLNKIKLEYERLKKEQESNVSAKTSGQDAKTKAEQEAAKKLGALRGDILADETKSFRNVRSQKLQLDQLEKALEAAETGKYAQLKTFAGKYIPGVDVDNEQALQSIVTQYALSELQKQTGPKTDFDYIKAAETQVQAGNTKGANKIILDRMRENAKYAEARYDAFKKFKKDRKDYENFEDTFSYSPNPVNPSPAPQAAIEFLMKNPNQINAFEQKYGYRPEGF